MHHGIILLAVCANLIEAGPVRYHIAFEQYRNVPRFYNISAEEQAPAKAETSKTSLIPSTSESLTSSRSTLAESTSGPSLTSTLSKTTATSAIISSETASSPLTIAFTPSQQISSSSVTSEAAASPKAAKAAVQSLSNAQAISTASFQSHSTTESAGIFAESSTATFSSALASTSTSSPPTDQQIVSSSVSAIAAAATKAASNSASSISGTPSAVTTSKTGAKYPTAENGNVAMANGYNQVFKTLSQTSTCNPKDNSAATACIDGQPATCEVDGIYTLESCPQGQSCFAVPLPAGQSGVNVGCYLPSAAAEKLAADSQSSASTTSSGPTSASADGLPPTSTANEKVEASQETGAASSGTSSSITEPSKLQAQVTGPETTSLQLPPVESAHPVSSTSTQATSTSGPVNIAQLQQQGASSQTVSTLASPSQAATAAAVLGGQSDGHSQQFDKEVTASGGTSSETLTTTSRVFLPSAGPTGNTGLVLSFPSDLASSPPTSTAQTPQASATANSLPEAPASDQKDFRPAAESVAVAAPPAGPSASLAASPSSQAGQQQVAANNVPAATVSVQSSTTATAQNAGITIVPQGAPSANSPATVTVTVTMTVHDRN